MTTSHNQKKERLLILTQVMDKKSSTLGFMTRWVEEISKGYESTLVICLAQGEMKPGDTVRIISLGKTSSDKKGFFTRTLTRIKYTLNFYRYIVAERGNYDKVLVHMNEEYIFLGSLVWKILGKKVYLWRNHYKGNWMARLARTVCEKVFYTSKFSYTADIKKFPNGVQMPVGVDVESLKTDEVFEVPEGSILSLARLDPSKNPEIILKALKELQGQGRAFTMNFVGGTSADKFPQYEVEVKKLKQDLGLGGNVRFVGAVPSTETYKYYLSHSIYVNVAKSGMLDKTIFKALAAGCLPVTTSIDFNEMVGNEFMVKQDSVASLTDTLKRALDLTRETRLTTVRAMQELVIGNHSLSRLVQKLAEEMR